MISQDHVPSECCIKNRREFPPNGATDTHSAKFVKQEHSKQQKSADVISTSLRVCTGLPENISNLAYCCT